MHVMIVTLGQMPDEPLLGRFAEVVCGLTDLIERHATEHSALMSSTSKDTLIYGLRLKSEPALIAREFRSLSRIQHYDKCLILELGTHHAESGLNAPMTWLTKRQSSPS